MPCTLSFGKLWNVQKVVPGMTEDFLSYYEYIMIRNFNSKSQELLTVDWIHYR